MKLEEFAKDGQLTVITGNLPSGEDATRQAIIAAVKPKTLLDADQLGWNLESADILMSELRELASKYQMKIVLHDGIIYCSEVIDGARELVRQPNRQIDKMITYADNYKSGRKVVAVTGGAGIGKARKSGSMLYVGHPSQLMPVAVVETERMEAPLPQSWKQPKLRKGAGHNKHSRKGKK